ncbi:MAG: PAS domain S-box protein [Parafilimonas sp.]|nr:PAS domain S-box protein [Parafilimonas sp.]
MPNQLNDKKTLFPNSTNGNGNTMHQLTEQVSELQKANEEIRAARRAALNLMEDAILSKEALERSEAQLARELADSQQLQNVSSSLIEANNVDLLYEEIINASKNIMHSFAVSMQMYIQERNALQLIAWKDFHPDAAKFWEWVSADSESSCGIALAKNKRIIIPDVENNEYIKNGDLEAYRLSGIHAVQSTPLISRSGKIVGMLSNHWADVYEPTERELGLLDVLARQTADLLERKAAEEALRKSEERYRTLFNSIDEGFSLLEMIFDDEGHVIDYWHRDDNPSFTRMTGIKDSTNKRMSELVPDLEPEWHQMLEKVCYTGEPMRTEYQVQQLGLWFTCYLSRVGNQGSPFIAAIYDDITERKLNEQRHAFLLKLNDAIRSITNPVIIQQTAMQILGEHLNVNRAFYGEMMDNEDTLLIGPGYAKDTFPLEGSVSVSAFDLDMAEKYYRLGKTVIIDDIYKDWPFSQITLEQFENIKVRAAAGVPLLKSGKVRGILSVHQTEPRKWTAAEITILEETAERTWAAVERAKAEQAQRESEERQAFLLHLSDTIRQLNDPSDIEYEAARLVAEKLEADRVHFAEVTEDERLVVRKDYVRGNAPSIGGTIKPKVIAAAITLERDEPVIIPDIEAFPLLSNEEKAFLAAEKIRSQLSVALSKQGKKVASFSVDQTTPRQWKPLEVSILQDAAERTLAAVEVAKAEQALRQSEERLRTLADAVPQVIWANDAEGKANYFNMRWYEYSGLNYEQSVGLGWEAIVHADDAPASVEKWNKALAAGEIFDTEYRLKRRDGVYRWFIGRNVPLKNEESNITGWFGSATDIEDLKEVQEALSQSEARLKITMESAVDYCIITMDTERKIQRWSSGAEKTFGFTEQEALGKSADIIFTEEDKAAYAPQTEMEAARDTGKAIDERWHQRKNGSRFFMSGVMRPIYDGTLTGYVKVARDITEQKLLEQQKDEFIAIASHELKTPVTSIKAYAEFLGYALQEANDEQSISLAERLNAQVDRLTELINSLFDTTKISEGQLQLSLEQFDMHSLMEEQIGYLQRTTQSHKIIFLSPGKTNIVADKERITQVLVNLISNAIKYSPNGGDIIINLERNEDGIQVSIKDKGLGIPADVKEKIFERFYRVQTSQISTYPGMGLGLYITATIVQRHAGKIWVESTPGKGSAFYFSLPDKSLSFSE